MTGSFLPAQRPWLDGVIYNEENREAHSVDGQRLVGVTTALRLAGKAASFENVKPDVLAYKASQGKAAHYAAHAFDDGDLVESSVADIIRPRLNAWRSFRRERRFEPRCLETVVVSREFGFLGRLDRFGRADRLRQVLADMKIGDPDAARTDLQLALYEIALREEIEFYLRYHRPIVTPAMHDFLTLPVERWSVELRADSRYRLRRYPLPGRTKRYDNQEALRAVRDAQVLGGYFEGSLPCTALTA